MSTDQLNKDLEKEVETRKEVWLCYVSSQNLRNLYVYSDHFVDSFKMLCKRDFNNCKLIISCYYHFVIYMYLILVSSMRDSVIPTVALFIHIPYLSPTP